MSNLDKICNTTHNMNSSFISTTEGVHIWHNDCLWGVEYNIGFFSPLCHVCQKTRSYNYNQFIACYANSSFIV